MATATATRCLRCATMLRNNRTICPCCGWDMNAPTESANGAAAAEAPVEKGPRKVVAKAGVKICPICSSSVPEEQLVDHEAQKICPTCAENMRNKAAKKAAPPADKDKK